MGFCVADLECDLKTVHLATYNASLIVGSSVHVLVTRYVMNNIKLTDWTHSTLCNIIHDIP